MGSLEGEKHVLNRKKFCEGESAARSVKVFRSSLWLCQVPALNNGTQTEIYVIRFIRALIPAMSDP